MKNLGLLAILAFIAVLVIYFIQRSKRGKIPEIRTIAGLDAIDEGIGRAVEMGKPIHYFLAGQLSGSARASGPLASLGVLSHIARLCAQKDVRLLTSVNYPDTTNLAIDVLQSAYMAEGKPEAFRREEMIKYFTAEAGADKNAIAGVLMREKPALSLLMGDISAEAVFLAEMSYIAGSMSIAGCQRETQLPFLVALCDYTLVGEELLVAGAYLSKNPVVLGSIQGQDIIKYGSIALSIIGALFATAGNSLITDFLKM